MPSIPLARASAVLVQFSFAKAKLVPAGLDIFSTETEHEHFERKAGSTGTCCIDRVDDLKIDLSYLKVDLSRVGYQLMYGRSQVRFNKKQPDRPYQMVRFIFRHESKIPLSFPEPDIAVVNGFTQLSSMALWRIRGYINPLTGGRIGVSINAEARVQRFVGEDPSSPVLEYPRDAEGKPYGTAIPLEAGRVLCAASESIHLF